MSHLNLAYVFLHGFGGSARTWDRVAARLAGRAWVVAPSLRGFGDALDDGARGFGVDDRADDVLRLVADLGLDRYVLVGASMGGKIALGAAARQPKGLRGVALLSASPLSPEPMTDDGRAQLKAAQDDERSAAAFVDRATAKRLDDADRRQAIADVLRASPRAWQAWPDAGSREDLSGRAADVRVPVRVLVGDRDEAITVETNRRETVGRLTDARLETLAGVGHLLALEAPDATADFLVRVGAEVSGDVGTCPEPPTYDADDALKLIDTAHVSPKTREVLKARMAKPRATHARFFDAAEMATLRAALARLVPPDGAELAGAIDGRLADGNADGWRFDALPPDREAYRRGVAALDELARTWFNAPFAELADARQDRVLTAAQSGEARAADGLNLQLFFQDLLAEACEAWAGDPRVQAGVMGYAGFADEPAGWPVVGLNVRDAREPRSREEKARGD